MQDWTDSPAPSCEDIAQLAQAARAALPGPIAVAAEGVVIRVVDLADDDTVRQLDLQSPFELTGLYDRIPLTEKSVMDQPERPDIIWLYRRPILDEWSERGAVPLGALVAHIVVHEFAHHFGWSDSEIARIEAWWE